MLSIKEKKRSYGSTAYYIVGEARPSYLLSKLYTLYYKADTLLDACDLVPQRGSIYSEEGRRHRFKAARFDQHRRKADFEIRTASVSRQEITLPPLTQDALSALYALRVLRLKQGERLSIPVFDSGRLYRVALTGGRIEAVKSGIGLVDAQRVDMAITDSRGQAAGRSLAVWLSADRRQVPVQLKAELAVGSFVLRLREARGLLPERARSR